MKNQKLILLFFGILFIPTLIVAQEEKSDYRNEIRMELFPLIQNKLLISYERYFKGNSHVFSCGLIRSDNTKKNIYGLELHYGPKLYLFEFGNNRYVNVKNKIYVTPFVLYRNIVYEGPGYKDNVVTYGLNLILGVKYVMHNRFMMDFGAGAKYQESEIKSNFPRKYTNNILKPGFPGVSFVVRYSIGFMF